MLTVFEIVTDATGDFDGVTDLDTVRDTDTVSESLRVAVTETLAVRDLDVEPLIVALSLTVADDDRVILAVAVRLVDCDAEVELDRVIVAVEVRLTD